MLGRAQGRGKLNKGFTLLELLIVVALIGILAAIGVPVFSSLLEKSRETTDIANVRSAYAEVMMAAIAQDTTSDLYSSSQDAYLKVVDLKQKKDGWDMDMSSLSIAGISQGSSNWKGNARAGGTCTVKFDNTQNQAFLIWSGYTISVGKQWKVYNHKLVGLVNFSEVYAGWPCSAISELIDAKYGEGQKVVMKPVTSECQALNDYIGMGGKYDIGVFVFDENGNELGDTEQLQIDSTKEFTINISPDKIKTTNGTGIEAGKNVKLGVQFFKMQNGKSVALTEAEARELESLFSIE